MTNFDTTDRDLAPSRDSRHSPELGLASLIMGAVLFLAAPITLILAVQVWAFSDHSPHTVQLHAWLARVGVSIALLTAGASIVFGAQGVRLAFRDGQQAGISLAALFLSLAALALWLVTAIGLLNATESLLRLHGH